METTCPHCRERVELTRVVEGNRVICPRCRKAFRAPVTELSFDPPVTAEELYRAAVVRRLRAIHSRLGWLLLWAGVLIGIALMFYLSLSTGR